MNACLVWTLEGLVRTAGLVSDNHLLPRLLLYVHCPYPMIEVFD